MHKIVSKALGMAALMGMGIGGYILMQDKNPKMAKDVKNAVNNMKDKAMDTMNDMKN